MQVTSFLVLTALILSGCGSLSGKGGYVESDIPGLAERVMEWQTSTTNQQCPPGTTAVQVKADAVTYTTDVGFQRERYSYRIICQ